MPKKYTESERKDAFWAKVSPEPNSGCWLWTSTTMPAGYGTFRVAGKKLLAHRVSLEMHGINVPDGLVADHLCRVRCCVNPAHLEVVTEQENMRRGMSPAAQLRRSTICRRGHEFTPQNTRFSADGRRHCRQCVVIWQRQHKARKLMKCEAG